MMVIFHGHSFEEGMDIGALVMLFHSPLGSYPPSQSRETITLSASPTPLCICTFLLQCKFRTIDNGQFISRKTPSNSRCELQHGFVYRLYHYYCLQSTSPQVFTSQYTKMGAREGDLFTLYSVFCIRPLGRSRACSLAEEYLANPRQGDTIDLLRVSSEHALVNHITLKNGQS